MMATTVAEVRALGARVALRRVGGLHEALGAVLAKQHVDEFIDLLAASVRSMLLDLESGERLDLEDPAADGVELVALASERTTWQRPAKL